jgi:hypothetical protein
MFSLKDGTQVEDIRLDRLVEFDERSRSFPISALTATKKPRSYTWRNTEWYDQRSEGACHIEGTEVLTERGWIDFRDINENDKLGTVNQVTQKLEFQNPEKIQKLDFEGNLITSNNRNLIFSVTPDHRMWIRKWNEADKTLSGKYEFMLAKDLGWYFGLLSAPSELEETILIEPIQIGEGKRGRLINGDDMASFMGIFLAEGCLYHPENSGSYRIEIAAVKESCRDEVFNIVSSLGFKVSTYPDRYVIHSKPLFDFLKQFYQTGALTKIIPNWIFTSPKRQCELFLNAFCLGDGHTTKDGRRFFYTSSKDLADGIQRLFLGLGIRSAVIEREPRDSCINGRIIKKENCSISYVVSPWRKTTLSILRGHNITEEYYKGKVYCATVKNSTLVTRYRGTVLISGNCVAFALGHELNARPAEVKNIPEPWLVKGVYWEAQRTDPWEGGSYPGANPFYEGTSVLAGVKVLQKAGAFQEYRWAFSMNDIIMGVGYNGPAVIGVNWYEGMFNPDKNGFIRPTGFLGGGHAVMLKGVNVRKRIFTIRNSWGRSWGKNGDCYITFDDLNTLMNQRGECVFLMKRTKKFNNFTY